ncbi:MAG TPA: efflux RND transporter periplasmic adaptor subunit [Magnetospirillum sp.]|jgi:RND family efflux transporter MFP subunit|nr:efflux RND transporter periplasmic adaptor subunit [Magnetospirillum sp.]
MAQTPRKFPLPLLLLAVVVLVGLAAGIYSFKSGGPAPSAQAQAPAGPPVTVAQPLKAKITDWSEFTGQFTPVDYVELRARVAGYLTEIHFTDGQMVNKGDLLFVIDPRPYEIALVTARSKVTQASASRDLANRQLSRAGELQKREFLAQSLLDQRESEARTAGAGSTAAQAAVREAELNLEFTRIVAPVSGRISARQISIGNLVTAGGSTGSGTLLTTIVSQDPLYFLFDMSEADFLNFQRTHGRVAGSDLAVPVTLKLMDENGWPHEGKLTFIDNQVDKNSGTIRARVTLANSDGFIAPGSFGRVRMPASAPYDALMIPDAAVMTDQNRKMVMIVAPDGTVTPKPVELGSLNDGLRAIKSGLTGDEQVIINGLMRARPGAKVTPQQGTIAAPGAAPATPAPAQAK